jgi:hypothetical protein
MNETQKRLAESQERVVGALPEKYILCIKTPTKAIVVEGRKDFTSHNNREATMTAWFGFLKSVTKVAGAGTLTTRFCLRHYPPMMKAPTQLYGFTIENDQEGTIAFGGRISSHCAISSEQTTIELMDFLQEMVASRDEELQGLLQEYGVGVYDL